MTTAQHLADRIAKEIHQLAQPQRAAFLMGFFKTKPGQYAAGDVLLGLSVPQQRAIAKTFASHPDLNLTTIEKLLTSQYHEIRLTALFLLIHLFRKSTPAAQQEIVSFYLAHTKHINNWDLVDASARDIVGEYLVIHPQEQHLLNTLAHSSHLWERRISIVATHAFIKRSDLKLTFQLAEVLLQDQHDLMHKAVGWMLREAGKVDRQQLKTFLDHHAPVMPRTMLRYAIEHFDEDTRQKYLKLPRKNVKN